MAADMPTGEEPSSPHSGDLELARRTLRGEAPAVDEYLERMACVRRFLTAKNTSFGTPLNAQELEDTIQNTLLALWDKLASFAGRGSLESWAYRFSYLELLNRLQSLRRRPRFLEDLGPGGEVEPAAEAARDPFEHEQLYRALERLEAAAADLLRAKHLEELTFEEIAAREGVPVNTVKTRYYRALERLRLSLGAAGGVPVAGRKS
jgi:RNA polymerase sigma factor (sigma-70 family)